VEEKKMKTKGGMYRIDRDERDERDEKWERV